MTRGRGRGGRSGCFRSLLAVFLLVAAGAGITWYCRRREGARPGPTTPSAAPSASPSPVFPRTASKAPPLPADFESVGRGRGVVAIVLDDVGYEEEALTRLEGLDGPIALAVLPTSPHAGEAVALAGRKNWDLLVHLPMDPETGRPEKGSVGPKDDDAAIHARVAEALAKVPGARGLNNHQGSQATADPRVTRAVLEVVRDRGLFFLDSRTTTSTVAEREARALGVATIARDVFLDDAAAEGATPGGAPLVLEAEWKRALEIVSKKGECVVIGHPRPATLEFLAARLPALAATGVRPVKVSDLVE